MLVLVGVVAGAFLLLRGDDAPSYSPLNLDDDPWAYEQEREAEFEARAAAGHSHVVYEKSPGGIVATARRVERWRPQVERAADAAGVDPDLVEGMVLLESAGRPDAVASADLEGAAGLTQILAETATGLLGMQVDLDASERLTRRLARARGPDQAARLRAQRARVDERFDPAKALAATGRYLKLAMDELGREDLAVVSYHMGIGNLQAVLDAYGDDEASYAEVYFDSAPNLHARAYRRLVGLGDDSKTYLWRVLASAEVMRLHREEPAELERLAELHGSASSAALVLHPPGEDAEGEDQAFPDEPGRYGIRPAGRALRIRPEAFALAAYIGRGTREVSGVRAPLTVARARGWSFDVRRRYRAGAQAEAFQYMLDRLQALNLIAWERRGELLHVTASEEGAELRQ
jgi:soluble lytic murein transglycosylase-like protein